MSHRYGIDGERIDDEDQDDRLDDARHTPALDRRCPHGRPPGRRRRHRVRPLPPGRRPLALPRRPAGPRRPGPTDHTREDTHAVSSAPRNRDVGIEMPAVLILVTAARTTTALPEDHPQRQALAEAIAAAITDVWAGALDGAVTPLLALVLDLVRELARALHTDEDGVLQALGRQYAGDHDAWTFADRLTELHPRCRHGRPATADGSGCPDCTGASQ